MLASLNFDMRPALTLLIAAAASSCLAAERAKRREVAVPVPLPFRTVVGEPGCRFRGGIKSL